MRCVMLAVVEKASRRTYPIENQGYHEYEMRGEYKEEVPRRILSDRS